MFVNIFKLITALGLIGVLFVLITQRELIFKPKVATVAQVSQQYTTDALTPPTLTQKNEEPQVKIPAQVKTQIETVVNSKAPVTKVASIPKNSVYIAMEEGQSDTDRTYRPAISPCKVTMGYKLGTFDTHFGISQVKFREEIDAASALWGNELGKTLFTYDERGPLIINLVYDERQAQTDVINNLVLETENAKSTADSLKRTYELEKTIYLGDGEQLTKDTDAFNTRYQIYTDKVTMYNSQGGAPRAEYEQMTQELEALKQLSKDLALRRDQLLAYMETINAKVTRYNDLVIYINGLIEKSNSLGARKFTEGRFNPNTNTIDIYQYNDLVKLRRVIAHEFGHVLGINHTGSPQSIMYAVNTGTSTVLSADDIAALYAVCP